MKPIDLNLLTIARIKNINEILLKNLYNKYSNAELILQKIIQKKSDNKNFTPTIPNKEDIKKEIILTHDIGAKFIEINSKFYPILLNEIDSAPLILTVKGNMENLSHQMIGVIGTRKPNTVGIDITKKIVKSLCETKFKICSGFAMGVDTIAHTVSLTHGTIAFLGHGINECYPSQNKYLMQKIIDNNGTLVTEFEFNEKPIQLNFPKRNRLIAGSSIVIVITQSSLKSGTMITANFANSFNKAIYAVPGLPFDENFAGNNKLIANNIAEIITDINNIGTKITNDTNYNNNFNNALFSKDEIKNTNKKFELNKNNNNNKMIFTINEKDIKYATSEIIQFCIKNDIEIKSTNINNYLYLKDILKIEESIFNIAMLEVMLFEKY